MPPPPAYILFRLTLARVIFTRALDLCSDPDVLVLSHGLIALHDALDNFTGAIASHLSLSAPKKESTLLTTLNLIHEYEQNHTPHYKPTARNEIVQLNAIRNIIKHQGIAPHSDHARSLVGPITTFFEEYTKRYFDVDWATVSRADLISDDTIKAQVKDVETHIDQGHYKEALEVMAIIKFKVFDEWHLRHLLDPKYDTFSAPSERTRKLRSSLFIFRRDDRGEPLSDAFLDLHEITGFLEKGIDRNLMKEFEDLTATVGFNNNREWKYVLKHGHEWGPPNWTKKNALFCYDFLVDAILKNQYRHHGFERKLIMTVYTIRVSDVLPIHDKNGAIVYSMSPDEEREATVFSRIEGQWEVYKPSDLLIRLFGGTGGKAEAIGYLKETDLEKIVFLETRQYVMESGKWTSLRKLDGG